MAIKQFQNTLPRAVCLFLSLGVAIASCSYITGQYEDKSFGLRVKILEESRRHLKVRLFSDETYGAGFKVIIGSPEKLKVTRHRSWFSETYYSATVDMTFTGPEDMVVLETLRGREKTTVNGKVAPAQWWTNTITMRMDPFEGVIKDVSFSGDVLPQVTP
jgi:hypothetical protein